MAFENGYVKLEANKPFTACLKSADGEHVEGKWGPQVRFTLMDGRKLCLDPPVVQSMATLGGQEFVITKKQLKEGTRIKWDVQRHNPSQWNGAQAQAPATALAAPSRMPPVPRTVEAAYDDGEGDWGAPPPPSEEQEHIHRFPPPHLPQTLYAAPGAPVAPFSCVAPTAKTPNTSSVSPNAQQAALNQPSRMTAALMTAIDSYVDAVIYARQRGLVLKFTEEDIRTSANTIYINACKEGRS